MATFLRNELDFILLVYGLGFVVLATLLLGLSKAIASTLPWRWLGAAAGLLGLAEWADGLGLTRHGGHAVQALRMTFVALAGVLLVEFARRAWAVAGGRAPGRWLVAVLAAVAALGAISGMRGLEAFAGYALVLPGGLWAAVSLWRVGRARREGSLVAMAVGLAGFALVEGLVAPVAPVWPATALNHDTFFAAFGLPIQLVSIIVLVPLILGF